MRLVGKAAIVTGAGRGIGKATALRFAREGADVLVPDLELATSQRTAREIQALGRKGVPMQMDVTRMADIQRMVETAVREFGKIDILVNNAGIVIVRDLLELTEAEWDRTMDVNPPGSVSPICKGLRANSDRSLASRVAPGEKLAVPEPPADSALDAFRVEARPGGRSCFGCGPSL